MTFHLSWLLLLLGLTTLTLSVVKEVYWEAKRRRLPASIAWVGPRKNEFFPMFRAWVHEYTAGLKAVEEGYKKVKSLNRGEKKKQTPLPSPLRACIWPPFVAIFIFIFFLVSPYTSSLI